RASAPGCRDGLRDAPCGRRGTPLHNRGTARAWWWQLGGTWRTPRTGMTKGSTAPRSLRRYDPDQVPRVTSQPAWPVPLAAPQPYPRTHFPKSPLGARLKMSPPTRVRAVRRPAPRCRRVSMHQQHEVSMRLSSFVRHCALPALFLAALAVLLPAAAIAQGTGTVTGRVTHSIDGSPLAGDSVSIASSRLETVT